MLSGRFFCSLFPAFGARGVFCAPALHGENPPAKGVSFSGGGSQRFLGPEKPVAKEGEGMQCEQCHEKEAEVHIREMSSEGVRELHLCRECAAHHTLPGGVPVMSLEIMMGRAGEAFSEANLFQKKDQDEEENAVPWTLPPSTPLCCPRCGTEAEEALRQGHLGCAGCFEAFRAPLESALWAYHGSVVHRGLRPSTMSGAVLEHWSMVRALRRELDRAVALEAYERAAELRDQLEHLSAPEHVHE